MIILDNKLSQHLTCHAYNANKCIYISCYKVEISLKPKGRKLLDIWEKIYKASERGVDVKILLNWNDMRRSIAKTNLYVATNLKKHGCDVRYLKDERCCHAKMFLFDDDNLIIGSHNLSVKSVSENFEMSVLIKDREQIKEAKQIFETIFRDAKRF